MSEIFGRWKNDGAPSPVVHSELPSLTQQQFASEADINVLIERYKRTGSFYNPLSSPSVPRAPRFEDIASLPDMMEQMDTIGMVNDMFMSLPASVRERFGHNPATFVEFAQNPVNFDECVKLGIFQKVDRPVEPVKVESEQVDESMSQSAQ